MNAIDEEKTPFDAQRRRYQWYTGYNHEDEYDKNPQWAIDMETEEEEVEDGNYTRPVVRFYDKYDPEHMWIKSDVTYDLTNTL